MYTLRNRVQLIGHLGQAPEMKLFDGGRKRVRFTLATNERYKSGTGEWVDDVHWHTLIGWNKIAETAEKYLTKGSEVAVEGRLITRSYTDKNGQKRNVTEVEVSEILRLAERKKEIAEEANG